ncbi:MerR family transcriptional regulator [Lentzea sp. NPDC059081]|uniref:MerR family transcriptional regulator n=1 Tax=Lentzea sp. NPDC059081 TaxID=3346719 RepID=UPI0036B7602B
MRIGELAEKAGVTPRALRYYEEMGLLRSTRTTSGQRIYDAAALDRVTVIRELYGAGLGSDLVSSILTSVENQRAEDGLLNALTDERAQLEVRMAALRDAANRLDVLIDLVENPTTHVCPPSLSADGKAPTRMKNVPA